eukprot:scaffold221486_cov73-Cyclotella_meneghiniana.AAC.2
MEHGCTSSALSCWLNAKSDIVVIGFEIRIINKAATVPGCPESIHLICIPSRTKVTVRHHGRPTLIIRGCWTG